MKTGKMTGKINWKLIIVLFFAIVAIGVTAYSLRKWNRANRARSGYEEGLEAFESGQWPVAARELGKYVAVNPNDVEALMMYGKSQMNIRPIRSNNQQQAINAFRNVLRKEPSNVVAGKKLMEIYGSLNMSAEAQRVAEGILEVRESAEIRRMLAVALINQRKNELAREVLLNILREHPDMVRVYNITGLLAEAEPGLFDNDAGYWYDQGVENNPSSVQVYVDRAGYYLRHGDFEKAMADLQKAETLDADGIDELVSLGEKYLAAGNYDKADEQLERAMEIDSDNYDLWSVWADAAIAAGDSELMQWVADNGLDKLNLENWTFLQTAAELYIRSGNLEKADECIQQLERDMFYPAKLAYLEGLLAREKGDYGAALGKLSQAENLGYSTANLAMLISDTLSKLGDTTSAIYRLRELVSQIPNYYPAHYTLGYLYNEIGKLDDALRYSRSAVSLRPGDVNARFLHAKVRVNRLAGGMTGVTDQVRESVENDLDYLLSKMKDELEVRKLQVRLALGNGDMSKAAVIISDLMKEYPDRPDVELLQVTYLFNNNDKDIAESQLRKMLFKYPESVSVVRYMVSYLVSENRVTEAEPVVTNALEKSVKASSRFSLEMMLADVYTMLGRNEQAYEVLNGLIEENPQNVSIIRSILRLARTTSLEVDEQKLIDRIRQIEGEQGRQWRYEQAMFWLFGEGEKNYSRIINHLKETLSIHPYDQESRLLLASAYEKSGQNELAFGIYEQALNRSPDDMDIILSSLAFMYRIRRFDQADELLERVSFGRQSDPRLSPFRFYSDVRKGKLTSAGETLSSSLVQDPNNLSVRLALTRLKIEQKQFEAAERLLSDFWGRDDISTTVARVMIALRLEQGRDDDAIMIADNLVENNNDVDSYLLRSELYKELERYDKAVEDIEKAINIDDSSVEAWLAKGRFYRTGEDFEKAAEAVSVALKLSPDEYRTKKQAGMTYLLVRDEQLLEKGRELLESCLKVRPDDMDIKLYKAQLLVSSGVWPRVKEGLDMLESVANANPQSPGAWALLAQYYRNNQQFARAIDYVLQGLSYIPNNRGLMLLKARCEMGRSVQLAVPTLKAVKEMYPEDEEAVKLLVRTYMQMNDNSRARDVLESYIEAVPSAADDNDVKLLLSIAEYNQGNYDKSVKIAEEVISDSHNREVAIYTYCDALIKNNDYDRLVDLVKDWIDKYEDQRESFAAVAENTLSSSPESISAAESILLAVIDNRDPSPGVLNSLAVLYHSTQRSAEAAETYRKVLSIDPDVPVAVNNLAWLICEYENEPRKALELADRGVEKFDGYIDLLDTRGMIYYRLEEYEKAVNDFNKCIELYSPFSSSLASSYYHLGLCQVSMGNTVGARESLLESLKVHSKNGGLSAVQTEEIHGLLDRL